MRNARVGVEIKVPSLVYTHTHTYRYTLMREKINVNSLPQHTMQDGCWKADALHKGSDEGTPFVHSDQDTPIKYHSLQDVSNSKRAKMKKNRRSLVELDAAVGSSFKITLLQVGKD